MLLVEGGRALFGEVVISGAKNSVLPILAATLLNAGESVIHNCPDLRDVSSAIEILRYLGCSVRREGGTVTVNSSGMFRCDIPQELMQKMRSSVIFLGPVLARCGKAVFSAPGGCELGPRPIDMHLSGLEQLGADIREHDGVIECSADKLTGEYIDLPFPSVGATENLMLAAVYGKGTTVISGAAREPEVEDLQNYLRACGANVYGAGTDRITVEGCEDLSDAEYRVMPDRIEAATYLCAVGACGGKVRVRSCRPSHLTAVIWPMRRAGLDIEISKNEMIVSAGRMRSPAVIRTMPYPGFPTDAMPMAMAMACICQGTSVFYEKIFENRFRHVPELMKMGADITVSDRMAAVRGVSSLHGARVECTDLRGGMAVLIAAAAAQGKSEIDCVYHIDRGYEHIERKLGLIGVSVTRRE